MANHVNILAEFIFANLLGSNLLMYARSAIKGGHTLVIYVLY